MISFQLFSMRVIKFPKFPKLRTNYHKICCLEIT